MSIPHVDRSLGHVDRTTVAASPAVVFELLQDLDDLVADHSSVRIDDWPDAGLRDGGATFWAVHQAVPTAGHAVSYEVTDVDNPHVLELTGRSDLYDANHRIQVAASKNGGTDVSWTVAIAPEQPATHQLLDDAALLATLTLGALTEEMPQAADVAEAAPETTNQPASTRAAVTT